MRNLIVALVLSSLTISAQAQDSWSSVANALGRSGRAQPDGTYVVAFPRGNLDVRVGDLALAPAVWMASSVTFSAAGDNSMMMGDLLLTADEVKPVSMRLVQEGVGITALHTHLSGETPRLMFLHVGRHGNAIDTAQRLRKALADVKFAPPANVPEIPADFDPLALEKVLGRKGRVAGGGVVVNVPRRELVTMDGMTIPPSMGISSTLLFQPLAGGQAAITGDLVLIAPEVSAVVRALGERGIEITTIHSHMLTESPRLFFLHYWGRDDLTKLAGGLRAALLLTNSVTGDAAPATAPSATDTASPESVLEALYAANSVAPGAKHDWNRFRSLFTPDARLMVRTADGALRTLSVESFITNSTQQEGPGFVEKGLVTRFEKFGHVAHGWSSYEATIGVGEMKEVIRGMNSFQLAKVGDRWLITSILWETEKSAGAAIPAAQP